MFKNKAIIIVYLLMILILVIPAIHAIEERRVYARASGQPSNVANASEPSSLESSPSPATKTPSPTSTQPSTKDTAPAIQATTGAFDAPVSTATQPADDSPPAPPPAAATTTPVPDPTVVAPTLSVTPSGLAAPLVPYAGPPSSQWQEWPVLPETLSDELIALYNRGIDNGNNPHAFSVLGDCQSLPEVFMGVYDHDQDYVEALPSSLQETVRWFGGSFERYSPTVKDGSTEGALLWYGWNDNLGGYCEHGESPLDCELRVHRPVIVFIHVGTHWEARNRQYLETIIDKILKSSAIPVLVTKADNRELDGRVNQNYANLAAEYNLPFWNFWASVQHLHENGMEPGSDMYLSQEGLEIHRQGALEALDAIWRMAEGTVN